MWIPLFLFLFTFFFYLLTYCASFNIADSGETIAVCDLLGIAHSPSYPLHALWGRLNCLLPLGQPMFRVTLSSMVTGTLAVVMTYLFLRILLTEIPVPSDPDKTSPGPRISHPLILETASLFGALTFAFSLEHWSESCGAKGGVYTLNTLITISMFFFLFKMRENGWFIRSLLLMAFVFGLGLADHWENQVVMLPAYLWFFLAGQKRVPFGKILGSLLRPFDLWNQAGTILSPIGFSNIIRGLTFGLLSLSVYLYLPLRAIQNPVLNWWDPRTASRFWGSIFREGFRMEARAKDWAMIGRNIERFFLSAHHQYGGFFTYLVFALMLLGIRWLWKKKQWSTAAGFVIFAGVVLAAVILYNGLAEYLEWVLDYFFPPVFWAVSLLSAAGIAGSLLWAADKWPTRAAVPPAAAAVSMALALMPLLLNYRPNDQSRYVAAYDEGLNTLKTVKDDGVIICNGDIDTLPLWYLQFVEGKRPRVTSFTLQLMSYDWYRAGLFKRTPKLEVPFGLRFGDYSNEGPFIQNMIDRHANELSFYFTNVATPSWLVEKNDPVPEGILWRIVKTKDLGYPFTASRLNQLWGTYRIRYLDPPERGYWDDYTEYVKNTYGIAPAYTGIYCVRNKCFETALWSFKRALKYSPTVNFGEIYQMEGETSLTLGDPAEAIKNYQESLKWNAQNAYAYARIGIAYLMIKDSQEAESAFRTALSIDPRQKEALEGLQRLKNQTSSYPRYK